MNKLVALALLPLTLVPACGCAGYFGGGDVVYQRDNDLLIECDNGGFVADLAATATGPASTLEGRCSDGVGTGSNGGLAYMQATNADGTVTMAGLGSAPWTQVSLDQVALNHANALCEALPTRSWWSEPADAVPVPTEFTDPGNASYEVVLCPDYSMYFAAGSAYVGSYTIPDGALSATASLPLAPDSGSLSITGTFSETGQLDFVTGTSVMTLTWEMTATVDAAAQAFCTSGTLPVSTSAP